MCYNYYSNNLANARIKGGLSMSKKKNNKPSSKPVVLRPDDDATASYLKTKTSTNKKIAAHRHRNR